MLPPGADHGSLLDKAVRRLKKELKIFESGFSTKQEGGGFGLHFCANAMSEMGGKLALKQSDQGAHFVTYLGSRWFPTKTSAMNAFDTK